MGKYIIALDAGTSSNRCVIFDKKAKEVISISKKYKKYLPKPGWVEFDAIEIWESMRDCVKEALNKSKIKASDVEALGITNQRETTIIWDKVTGKPIYHAICWQCRRTASICDSLKSKKLTEIIRKKTGLVIDAYFSATKIKWILDNVKGAKEKAREGRLLFGTVDTWLAWNLSGKKLHITDYSNASRTMLFNIKTLKWDEDILKILNIPKIILPEVKPSSFLYGVTEPKLFGSSINISGIAGDQQCALYGETCFKKGDVKSTYGTGGFLLMNIGDKLLYSKNGLLTTIAWGINGKITYAIEGSVFIVSSAIHWLRDGLSFISKSSETEKEALKVKDTNGCIVVPSFTGLGAPYWDQYSRGAILGLTSGVNKQHIIRAILESIAFQMNDVISAMSNDTKINIKSVKVDGGASANNLLMQMQADISDTKVIRAKNIESTALGAAYLAGLAVSFWKNENQIKKNQLIDKIFTPKMKESERKTKIKNWEKAVNRTMYWAKENA